ncbi:hydrogenase nickel incorporation protein HypB [Planctomycetales bacterium ZRK34]|nr:hydrogenase nickel incorporation protein HypB [Planctomycetales bacterium ZRK34]
MKIPVVKKVLKLNDEVAQMNRRRLKKSGVFSIELIGSPGSGKTALIERTLDKLAGQMNVGVAVGDLATSYDAERIGKWTEHVVQINTGRGCHLDANQVMRAMRRLPLDEMDLMIVENVGNIICPANWDLGLDAKVALFTASEGDDKPIKHPPIVCSADVIVLNKVDLLPHVEFDVERFTNDIRTLNPDVPIVQTAATRGQVCEFVEWIAAQMMPQATA